ncbi:MAG: SPOR domain-containing protein [Bacteroidia bacterium]
MKQFLFLVSFFLCLSGIQAQDNSNTPQAQTAMKVKLLIDKKSAYNRLSNGEYDGYRIKIHFGVDRAKAREIKSRFQNKYNDYVAYEDYQQPNWVVAVGDFRTKLEAFEAWKKVQAEFPNSFIVKSRIRPMRL